MKIRSRKGREALADPIIGACYDPWRQELVSVSADTPASVTRWSQSQAEEDPPRFSELRVVAPGHSAGTEFFPGIGFPQRESDEDLNREVLQYLAGTRSTEAADWSRSSAGVIALTTVEPTAVDDALEFAYHLAAVASPPRPHSPAAGVAEGLPPFSGASAGDVRPFVRVETPMRALTRFWVESHLHDASNAPGCAFVFVDSRSCSIAFWSLETGLVHETEQEFPEDSGASRLSHASNIVTSLLNPASLDTIGIPALSLLVVAGEARIVTGFCAQLRSYKQSPAISAVSGPRSLEQGLETLNGVEVLDLTDGEGRPISPYDAIAKGLVGSADVLPLINLADPLERRIERIEEDRRGAQSAAKTEANNRAVFASLAPVIALVAFVLASAAVLNLRSASLGARLQAEDARHRELAHVRELRGAAGERLKWFIDVNNQILKIRGQQPAAVSLLLDLNARWPQGDPSWRITSLKAQGTGAVEISGVTEREESIRRLATALEFGGGFSGLQPEIKSETRPDALTIPGAEGEPAAPHRYNFTIRATYGPFVGLSLPARPVTDPTQSQFPPAPLPGAVVAAPEGSAGRNALPPGEARPESKGDRQ
ncbi:MAG: PilN domain-containing protein [Blastocatellia bacterium]